MSTSLLCLVWLCVTPQEGSLPYIEAPIAAAIAPADAGSAPAEPLDSPAVLPILPRLSETQGSGVEWSAVSRSSLRFLAIMHAFRWATETDTREGGAGLGSRYIRSVTNMHGWADGDPYYVNYMGHPAQGAISGRLFLNHDPRYRQAEFGRDALYWKGKLRAAAFSWAFSEQFEIGILSEASIGRIQSHFPQQGFVDHVVTPTVGMGLSVAEDSIDKYFIKPMEARIHNKWARLALRTGLNPTRSFANMVDKKAPWHRETRGGVLHYAAEAPAPSRVPAQPHPASAPYELRVVSNYRTFESGPCVGGGAEAAARIAPQWQLLLDVNGCRLLGLKTDLSGDALFYQAGSRWTPLPSGKWSPYVELLLGGLKVTHEQFYPDKKEAVERANPNPTNDPNLAHRLHSLYTSDEERNGLVASAGTGVDYKLNDALAIRIAGIEYSRSTVKSLGGLGYSDGFQVSSGLVLRLGTW